MASGNHARGRHHYPVGDGGRRLCAVCGKPTTRECAEHPEIRAKDLMNRVERLLQNGALSPYQRHKLRLLKQAGEEGAPRS